jgi:hypothetical protein
MARILNNRFIKIASYNRGKKNGRKNRVDNEQLLIWVTVSTAKMTTGPVFAGQPNGYESELNLEY